MKQLTKSEAQRLLSMAMSIDGERSTNVVVNAMWQKALMQGLKEARAKAWQRTARKSDTDRVKEMAGEWILYEPPHWTHFQRPCWRVAMQPRYGLEINPAIGPNIANRCFGRKSGRHLLLSKSRCVRSARAGTQGGRRQHSQARHRTRWSNTRAEATRYFCEDGTIHL